MTVRAEAAEVEESGGANSTTQVNSIAIYAERERTSRHGAPINTA